MEYSPFTLAHLCDKTLSDGIWRQLWRGLGLYLENKSTEREFAEQELAKERENEFQRHFFQRSGWPFEARDPQGTLLLEGRRAVARVFGGVLPHHPGLGLAAQIESSPLTRWLRGERLEYSPSNTPQSFYAQVRKLLVGNGIEEGKVEALIEAAIFSERGWGPGARDPQGALLLEGRRAVARVFGGVLPRSPGLGLAAQKESSPLTRWLRGEQTNLDSNLLPQIRTLLIQAGGLDPARVEVLLEKVKP